MRIVILGAPGAGKGTQAEVLSDKFLIPHISTGDIFRYHIKNATNLGIIAKQYIDKGFLVPDSITEEIVIDRIQQSDCKNGFILDGFPRTIPQAEFLDAALEAINMGIDAVLNLQIEDIEIVTRMLGRRSCAKCGMSFHIVFNPPKVDGICDKCNNILILREDDTENTVIERLKTYHKQTEPLIGYYFKKGKLFTINGKDTIGDTSKEVFKVLGVK